MSWMMLLRVSWRSCSAICLRVGEGLEEAMVVVVVMVEMGVESEGMISSGSARIAGWEDRGEETAWDRIAVWKSAPLPLSLS